MNLLIYGFLILAGFGSSLHAENQTQLLEEKHLQNSSSPAKLEEEEAKQNISEEEAKQNISKEISSLKQLIQNKNSLEIHNQAMKFLKSNRKGPALLLLKKNAYQHAFPPSWLALLHLKNRIFFTPLIWHGGMLFAFLIGLLTFVLVLKKNTPSRIKNCVWSLAFFGLTIFSGSLLIKPRVSLLQDLELKSSPFMEAPAQTEIQADSDLIVLKQTEEWLRVRSPNGETGWLLKSELFQIF